MMISEDVVKINFLIFQLFGVWEPINAGWLYGGWQIINLIVTGIGLPLSFFMSFIYAENSEDAMKIPVLLCTILSVSVKCVLIFSKNPQIRELLQVLREMDNYADRSDDVESMCIRLVCFVDIL